MKIDKKKQTVKYKKHTPIKSKVKEKRNVVGHKTHHYASGWSQCKRCGGYYPVPEDIVGMPC